MNTPNNLRQSREKPEAAYEELLRTGDPEEMMEVLTSEYRGRTQYFEAQAAELSPAAGQNEGGSGQ